MFYYRIAELVLQSENELSSFGYFASEPAEADVILTKTDEIPQPGNDLYSGAIVHRATQDGFFFHSAGNDRYGLYANTEYNNLRMLGAEGSLISGMMEWYIRIALECRFILKGYVSLHSAAVETQEGTAVAFTGPSGIGKSTRAFAWMKAFGTSLINGDRPLINVRTLELYGVPWDGKERCFRNVHYPLRTICEVRRSVSVYAREMSYLQRRKLLTRQCFIPMWDTQAASVQMINISRLAKNAEIVRVFSGPASEDVRALDSVLKKHQYYKEEQDMKAKTGFILRNVVDEFILMPTGDNIGTFNGTVLLNDVSAFVWEKLQNPMSKDDLLKAILDEYEVDKTTASADLDALLETLRRYGVIEED